MKSVFFKEDVTMPESIGETLPDTNWPPYMKERVETCYTHGRSWFATKEGEWCCPDCAIPSRNRQPTGAAHPNKQNRKKKAKK